MTLRYGQNEEYSGHFKDGSRHGHGTLKSAGAKNSLDTVYVGNWENDIKSGYGVLDYIVRCGFFFHFCKLVVPCKAESTTRQRAF